jgi:hypothetical protein
MDRFSSGDFVDVWERMTREVRDGITQDDFVTFYETCKKTGIRFRVTGVSMDAADGEAVVRVEAGGAAQPSIPTVPVVDGRDVGVDGMTGG